MKHTFACSRIDSIQLIFLLSRCWNKASTCVIHPLIVIVGQEWGIQQIKYFHMRKEANRRRCASLLLLIFFFSLVISLNSNWVACVCLGCYLPVQSKRKHTVQQKKKMEKSRPLADASVKHVFSLNKIAICDVYCLKQKTIFGVACFGMFFFRNSIGIRSFVVVIFVVSVILLSFFSLWKWHTINSVLHICREKERRMSNSFGNWSANKTKTSWRESKKKWLYAERLKIKWSLLTTAFKNPLNCCGTSKRARAS